MDLRIEQLAGNITRAVPVGRWDIAGAAEIDLRLAAVAGSGRPVILDLAEVSYISSMGIRAIIMSAKAARLKGGRLVLLAPNHNVEEALNAVRVPDIVPLCRSLDEATAALAG